MAVGVGYHPVLDMQTAMRGGGVGQPHGLQDMMNGTSDSSGSPCSNQVAMLVLGSIAVLLLLRLGGFRFSFGGGVGG